MHAENLTRNQNHKYIIAKSLSAIGTENIAKSLSAIGTENIANRCQLLEPKTLNYHLRTFKILMYYVYRGGK